MVETVKAISVDSFITSPICPVPGLGSGGSEICSHSKAGSYFRLIDFVYYSTLGLRVIKKKKVWGLGLRVEG